MKLHPVKSSNIAAVGYDSATRELRVKFSNGAVHSYADVPVATHLALVGADSVGRHFSANIRGKFTSQKLEPAP